MYIYVIFSLYSVYIYNLMSNVNVVLLLVTFAESLPTLYFVSKLHALELENLPMGKWICHINKRRTINIVSLPSAHTQNIFKVTFIHFIQCILLHQCCFKLNRKINVNSPLKQPRLVLMQVYVCRKYIIV